MYQSNFINLITNNYNDFFKDRIVETGFRKAFKGNWGAEEHTKRQGIVRPRNKAKNGGKRTVSAGVHIW